MLYTAIGIRIVAGENMSLTVPAATLKKADPAKAVRNRKIRWTGALLANATGKLRRTKDERET